MGVDAVTREGEHRRGYAYVFSLGHFELRAPGAPQADAHNWQRFKRQGNVLVFETMVGYYAAEKLVHFDSTIVTMDVSTKPSRLHIKVARTYEPFAIDYDDMVRRHGYPGDDILDRSRIGEPMEIMDSTCADFVLAL